MLKNTIIYFLTGGIFTTLIVLLEQSGSRVFSGLAALMPIFTLVSYIFIGPTRGDLAVSQHAQFVLWGTIIAWIPYMLVIIYLSPKIGTDKALLSALSVFIILALLFIFFTGRYHLFQ